MSALLTKSPMTDRFIAKAVNRDTAEFSLCSKENAMDASASSSSDCNMDSAAVVSDEEYASNVASSLSLKRGCKVLSFKDKAPTPSAAAAAALGESAATNAGMRVLYTQNKLGGAAAKESAKKNHRSIPQAPTKVLDAPGIQDDFYLNLLDWNANNILAVALDTTVYLWNAETGTVEQLMQTTESDNMITSLSWVQQGNYLAIGTNNADVQLWDAEKGKQLRSMKGHMSRVGSLAWNNHILSSGSRDSMIFNHDVRISEHLVAKLEGHQQEVCGLKWSPDGSQLASGGNDNLLNIWDAGATTARFTMDHHQAAVKALAWCPWQANLLASGGGTADRTLRFWNTQTGACVNSIDTKSQVCSIVWNRYDKELVTSHGFSQNQLIVWKYPTLVKMAELTGHTSRVLHMALSPDGQSVVSAAGDETLRFWNVFAAPESKSAKRDDGASRSTMLRGMSTIR